MLMIFLFVVLLLVCFNIPSLIAVQRFHPNALKIVVINVVFGLTIIGWFYALYLALKPIKEEK